MNFFPWCNSGVIRVIGPAIYVRVGNELVEVKCHTWDCKRKLSQPTARADAVS